MSGDPRLADRFLALHRPGAPLLMSNPWDVGSARLNVLMLPGCPSVPELAAAGVARVSVGGAFAFAALGTVVEAATELREQGTAGYFERMAVGSRAVREAFAQDA